MEKGREITDEELAKVMEESFTKWHKAYEMLAAGQEPDKEEMDEEPDKEQLLDQVDL